MKRLKNFSREQFESWISQRQEPGWFTDLRRQALERFHALGYPDRGTEAWRRLPWDKISFEAYPPSVKVKEFIPQNAEELKRQGVILVSLDEALRSHSDLLKQYWSKVVRPDEGKFGALATAFTTHGAFLYIPSVELPQPISIQWDGKIAGETIFPHLLIVAQPNSRAAIIVERNSSDEEKPGMVYGIIEALAARDSQLDILTIQQYGRNVDSFVTQRVKLEQGSQVQTVLLGLGSRIAFSDIETILAESGANAELLGFFFGEKNQHFESHTLQNHQGAHTQSDLLFKSALRDDARSVYYGLIKILKGAQQTNAYQANRNLLLGKGAKADSVPVLEIEADDVRCTHGATVGPVDEEQKFYLMCRGLDQATAEQLLLYGFFEQGIERVRHEGLREVVRKRLTEKIEQGTKHMGIWGQVLKFDKLKDGVLG